jgi:hypothetical protein
LLRITPRATYVLDPVSGKTIEEMAPLSPFPIYSLGRVSGDTAIYTTRGGVAAYDLAREQRCWERPLAQEVIARVGFADEAVFLVRAIEPAFYLVVTSRFLVGGSLGDGSIRWHAAAMYDSRLATGEGGAVWHDGFVYATLSSDLHDANGRPLANPPLPFRLACLEASTGKVIYDVPRPEFVDALDHPSHGRIQGEYIACGSRKGLIALFRRNDGRLVWCDRHKEQTWTPVIEGNRLYVEANDGNILIYEGVV